MAAGNWIIDQVKIIDVYPQRDHLANILRQSQGTGGSPYNVLIDLAKLEAPFPLMAAGLVGEDDLGRVILEDCREHRIDTKSLCQTPKAPTSYTDVMTEQNGGHRTFFHHRGANALWDGSELDFAKTSARIFHLGYLLLLDALDLPDRKFGTKAAALLHRAQEAGLKTSIDTVSEDSDRFVRVVPPALKYADYCILNELEAGKTTGLAIRGADGSLNAAVLPEAGAKLLGSGVRDWVVVHFPEGSFACSRAGGQFWQSSLNLPGKVIAGTAGAGDAFASGVLLGLHEGWEMPKCLLTGVCVAAASLFHPTCAGGIVPLADTMKLQSKYGLRPKFWP